MATFTTTYYRPGSKKAETGTFTGKDAREVLDKLRARPDVDPYKLLTVKPV